MKKLHDALNVQLSNWVVVYVKLHHFHWYVTGPHFPVLHAKFEELYNFSALKFDEVAERILTIGGQPVSTMKEMLELATIKEVNKQQTENDMLAAVIKDFEALVAGLKEVVKLSEEEAEDDATADLLIGQIEELQKHIWMLKATLG